MLSPQRGGNHYIIDDFGRKSFTLGGLEQISDDCLDARFEILLDGKTEFCRDTMLTAMGAAHLLKHQRPNSNVAVRDLQTGQLIVLPVRQQQ
jgi:hypothetical protein